MQSPTLILEIATILLLLSTLAGLITNKFRLPYTVGLVLIGLGLGLVNRLNLIRLPEGIPDLISFTESRFTPELILGLLITPILFDAAFHLNWTGLSRELPFILLMAVPGVLVTTMIVGGIMFLGKDLVSINFTFPVMLLFGAMIAATDPVSVIALFKSLGVPKRLLILLEGESLFNDGTAIVLFTIMINLVLGLADHNTTSFSWFDAVAEFFRIAGGGLIIGLISGWLVSNIIERTNDYLIETTLTTILAFGVYLLAEEFHLSGVLAVVAAGLVNGNISHRNMSPTTHILVTNFWEYASFLSNSTIFLLIGLDIDLTNLVADLPLILLAILAVIVSRIFIIYGITWVNKNISWRWRHILMWGGMRGAITLVLALNLPQSIGYRDELQNMAFGVVLFTILVQGFTMRPLINRLSIVQRTETQMEYERRHARAVASRASYYHLESLYKDGLFSDHTWQIVKPRLKEHSDRLADAVKEVMEIDPDVENEELDTARREALRAQRRAFTGLLTDGVISEENYSYLVRAIDFQLSKNHDRWINMIKDRTLISQPVSRLMTVVLQIQDVENAIDALNEASLPVTRLSSTGGFLGRRNVTLIIGFGNGQEEMIIEILKHNCRRRVEYVATPLEGSPFHLPLSTPVMVGGATIFTLHVEHYEEI